MVMYYQWITATSIHLRHAEDINLRNVAKAVFNGIIATLGRYFLDRKTDGYALSQSRQLEDCINTLVAHGLIVWGLKQKQINSLKKYPGMLMSRLIQHLTESSAFWGAARTLKHLHKTFFKRNMGQNK